MATNPQGTAVATKPGQAAEQAAEPAGILDGIFVLKSGMQELWITFIVKFLGIAAYAIVNSTLVLWLSADLHYNDQNASYMVMIWSLSMTVATILVGSLTDALGLRKTFLLGVWICLIARLVMAVTTIKWLALAGGLIPLAVGEAMGTPVLVAAIRRYSTTAQRSISFSVFYVMMNVGFSVAGFLFDWLRQTMGEHGHLTLPLVGFHLTTYRALFLASFGIELIMLPILYFGIREGAEASDEDGVAFSNKGKIRRSPWQTIRDTVRDTGRNLAALARQNGFYRLLAFLMLIAFVKLIYMMMYYAYPKFGIRELGEGAPIGRLWAINSILIIFLVPITGILTRKSSAYRMVTIGSAISAGSVFVMAMPTSWFQSMANGMLGRWLGGYLGLTGAVNPWYVMILLFVLLLSIGEAFYSPRVYEYAAAIAPKGQEASYGALSYVPFFLAKLLVGVSSGILLANYCPETGPRHSGTMWLIIAVTTMIAPVGLIVLRRWIRVAEAGRDE